MLLETIDLSPAEFMMIQKQERALLVLLGHATNELTVLTRLFVIAGNFDTLMATQTPPPMATSNSPTLTVLR